MHYNTFDQYKWVVSLCSIEFVFLPQRFCECLELRESLLHQMMFCHKQKFITFLHWNYVFNTIWSTKSWTLDILRKSSLCSSENSNGPSQIRDWFCAYLWFSKFQYNSTWFSAVKTRVMIILTIPEPLALSLKTQRNHTVFLYILMNNGERFLSWRNCVFLLAERVL